MPTSADGDEIQDAAEELRNKGYVVLQAIHSMPTIEAARATILEQRGLLRNTRPTPSAGHRAGFHRLPTLRPLHELVSSQSQIRAVLDAAVGGKGVRTVGLSDITMNRSQGWHRDLLRGPYQKYLDQNLIWDSSHGVLFKALLYLQRSSSLRLIAGSHLMRCRLDSDDESTPSDEDTIDSPWVEAGDVILMDLRMSHCGSPEKAFAVAEARRHPKLLVSTVFGAIESPLTAQLENGNSVRQADWDRRHEGATPPIFEPL
jgi:ectoine hydroxylase-related dioxygenase (phytanoyl-CoA dioxygenase family)